MAARKRWFEKKGEAGKVAKKRGETRFKVVTFKNGKKAGTQFYVGDKLPKGLVADHKAGKIDIAQV